MSINDFYGKLSLINSFVTKMKKEAIPFDIQLILIKTYASKLNINLTDKISQTILSEQQLDLHNLPY